MLEFKPEKGIRGRRREIDMQDYTKVCFKNSHIRQTLMGDCSIVAAVQAILNHDQEILFEKFVETDLN